MALLKLCSYPGCRELVAYGEKYCSKHKEAAMKQKQLNNRYYDDNVRKVRDSKYDSFYHSNEWLKTVEVVKNKYKYMDIYSLYVLGNIEYGNICHHIEILKTDNGWEHRLDINGIIYLTNANHAAVHAMYEKDYEGTKKMLYRLLCRFNNEYNIYPHGGYTENY